MNETDRYDEVRQITDSKVLAAMAHPLRRRLLDVLRVYGPATVSSLSDHTGERVGNVSHHLKVLAGADLIDEAPDLAKDRREHWWRLRAASLRWSSQDFHNDPAGDAIAQAALSLSLEHHVSAVRAWYAASEDQHAHWDDAAFSTDKWLQLTPVELAELSHEVIDLFERWATRTIPADDVQREPVLMFGYGIPSRP